VATDLTGGDALPSPEVVPEPAPPAVPHPHKFRFGLIYTGLGLVLALAIAGVAFYGSRSVDPTPKWSTWKPKGGGQGAAMEIAQHVAGAYRLPNGEQLVDILSKAPAITVPKRVPISFVAVKGAKGSYGLVQSVTPTNSVMYSLCGLGVSCSIPSGKPSADRGRLVRREILELALYTFKYVHGMDNVIAFIPPTAGKPKLVVYLRHQDLAQQLKRPLVTTLRAHVPLPATIPADETRVIEATTRRHVYKFGGLAQSPQGDLAFVLAPLPPS
jgi:hypothetical protein